MSLFVGILKGDYDALLTWPFSHRVTFTLLDQCQDPAARRNITYTVSYLITLPAQIPSLTNCGMVAFFAGEAKYLQRKQVHLPCGCPALQ